MSHPSEQLGCAGAGPDAINFFPESPRAEVFGLDYQDLSGGWGLIHEKLRSKMGPSQLVTKGVKWER